MLGKNDLLDVQSRAANVEARLAQRSPGTSAGIEPTSNHDLSRSMHELDLGHAPFLVAGTIVDTVGYIHNYKVALDRGLGVLRGILLGSTSLGLVGAKAHTSLTVSSRVLCAYTPGQDLCWILGVMPDAGYQGRDSLSDVIVPGSNVGLAVDAYTQGPFLLGNSNEEGQEASGSEDYSCGRPSDGLGGDWGAVTETGLGIHLDPFLTFLRVNEETGVWGFYHDDLLRVSGHNLQMSSSGWEREDVEDEGAVWSEEGYAAHYGETLGLPTGAGSPFTARTAEEVQIDEPWTYYLEPLFDDQQPLYRLRRFRGHLGTGEKTLLQALLAYSGGSTPARYSVPGIYPGLLDIQSFWTGRHLIRSAKGICLAKQPQVVSPQRKRPAHSARLEGSTPTLQSELSPTIATGEESALRAAAFLDQLTYCGNFEGLHPFWNMEASWYLPEQSELPGELAALPPEFDLLQTQQYLPTPEPVSIEIDGRYGTAQYFPNNAYIALLDDGGIVLCDGWGSEIRMTGGSIWRSASGDLWDLPGRNYNCWAGYDFIARAHNSADVTASHGDVRVKAQNNLMLLGGNEVCGGILLESRAPSAVYDFSVAGQRAIAGGIVLKAQYGQVVSLARDIVLGADLVVATSKPREGLPGAATNPLVVIDVGVTGKILSYARSFERYLEDFALDVVSGIVNEVWSSGTTLGGPLRVVGSVLVSGWVSASGSVVAGGTVVTPDGGLVGKATSAAMSALADALFLLSDRLGEQTTYLGAGLDQGREDYKDKAHGDVELAEFSLRTDSDYRTMGLALIEARWQQMARQVGQTLPVWTEPTVVTLGGWTRPHPGQGCWELDSAGRRIDLTLFDDTTGQAKDRGTQGALSSEYTTATLSSAVPYTLENNYSISISLIGT